MNFDATWLILSTSLLAILANTALSQDLPAEVDQGRLPERFEGPAAPTKGRPVLLLKSTIPPIHLELFNVELDNILSSQALSRSKGGFV